MKLAPPDIVIFPGKKLAGISLTMSFAHNRTPELWRQFMPVRKRLARIPREMYSVEIYPDRFFEDFSLSRPFEKWAAMEAGANEGQLSPLHVPGGMYAVFFYKGLPEDAAPFYEEIFNRWLPTSSFRLDNRPHFALMSDRYENTSPDSEETIWIPIKPAS